MRYVTLVVLFFVFSLSFAQEESLQRFANLGDFRLENGEIIKNCCLGYRLIGKLDEKKSNAILFPTWFGGNTQSLSRLIGPNGLVDPSRYFIVAVDALGNGISSSPSNSVQKGEAFPRFNIRDMVRSQHQLLTKELGLNHLHGIIGGSMGGMQVFEWIVSYPDFMERAVAYVGTSSPTSYDLLLWHTMIQAIEMGKKNSCPEEEIIKTSRLIMALVAQTPDAVVEQVPAKEFHKFMEIFQSNPSPHFTSDNYLGQLRAMLGHDISAPFGNSMEKAAFAVKAKLFVIVCAQDHIVYPKPALDFAKLTSARTLVLDNNRGHLGVGYELKRVAKEIDEFFAGK